MSEVQITHSAAHQVGLITCIVQTVEYLDGIF